MILSMTTLDVLTLTRTREYETEEHGLVPVRKAEGVKQLQPDIRKGQTEVHLRLHRSSSTGRS